MHLKCSAIRHKVYRQRTGLFHHPRIEDMEGDSMPDVSQKEVGRRLYHVHREKSVEEAIKKIKHGVGTDWSWFSTEEIDLLGHLLQCTWNTIDQKIWNTLPFASMTGNDVRKILSFGEGVGPGKNPDQAAVAEIKKILLSLK
jgi:hypothetical protein